MPYKTPLRKKGVNETVYAHAVKLCWFTVKFEDIQNKIRLKKFCENFEEIVVSTGIWEKVLSEYNINCSLYRKDGTFHKPNYDKLFRKSGWINKYEWKEQYPIFKADMLIASDDTERERYIRYKRKLNDEDYNLLETCYGKEQEYTTTEKTGGKDMTYYRNKNNETISNVDERLRKRNGFDKTRLELEGNVKTDIKAEIKHQLTPEEKIEKLEEMRERMDRMTYD